MDKQTQKQVIEIIEKEIKDCKTLKRLSEKTILRAKTEKDYECIVSNMQHILENNHAIFRLTKLKIKISNDKGLIIHTTKNPKKSIGYEEHAKSMDREYMGLIKRLNKGVKGK